MRSRKAEIEDYDFIEDVDITDELSRINDQQQNDAAREIDQDSRSLETLPFDEVEEYDSSIIARVFAKKGSKSLREARVLASNTKTGSSIRGTIQALGDREFSVLWDDGKVSVEKKSSYRVIRR